VTVRQEAGTGGMAAPVRPARRPLSPDECYPLLVAGRIGRVVFDTADGLASLAVSYAVAGRAVVLRTGADTDLAVRLDCPVGFEVDQPGTAPPPGWSVLVTGRAARVTSGRQLRQLAACTGLRPWPGGAREVYVQIIPYRITGQRFCG
jgi:hypothetical protein